MKITTEMLPNTTGRIKVRDMPENKPFVLVSCINPAYWNKIVGKFDDRLVVLNSPYIYFLDYWRFSMTPKALDWEVEPVPAGTKVTFEF